MRIKRILLTILLLIIALLLLTTKSNASLYLNNLDFDVQINTDGSMDVTEKWDIEISDTNTLYKTFKRDSSKYSGITNVVVTEVGGKELTKDDSWAYHMQKDYYYGGLNNSGEYEICWGVGLENSSDTREYLISYRVLDAIAKYDDIAELYWQFIGSDFEVSAENITGTIKLPAKANSKDDIKVWGHVETLNGEIYATSEDTVEFNLTNFRSGRYVEIRVAFPTNLVEFSNRTQNHEELTSIINEEIKWADAANIRRERQQQRDKLFDIGKNVVSIFVSALLALGSFKHIKTIKNTTKILPTQELDYFREIPGKDETPADALFLYNKGVTTRYSFGPIFSSTLLNLSLKGYFKIETELNEKGKEQVYISVLRDMTDLNYEEKKIAIFICNAMKGKDKLTIKDLQKYIKSRPETVSRLIEKTGEDTKNKNIQNGNYSKETASKKSTYACISVMYGILAMGALMFTVVTKFMLLVSAISFINTILTAIIAGKFSTLTQKGIDEREKWKGLKKYMEDFSLLNEKEIPALTLWEEFLVYATAFGIANKVIKQLKLVYPEIENMDNFNTTSYIYLMSHTNFNSSFNTAINSSISSAMSSGTGGGGGFSGGGGGGRRPEAADGGR